MKLNNKELKIEQLETINDRIEELTARHEYKPQIEVKNTYLESDNVHGCETLVLETNRGTYYCCYPEFNNYEFYVGLQNTY